MKKLLLFVFGLYTSFTLSAQHAVYIGAEIGFASRMPGSYDGGYGTSIEYGRKISQTVSIKALLGFAYFKSKTGDDFKSFLPARVGVERYISPDFFLFGEGGVSHYQDFQNKDETNLSFAVGTGYVLPVDEKKNVRLSAFYTWTQNTLFNHTWFGIRAAFGFSFGTKK